MITMPYNSLQDKSNMLFSTTQNIALTTIHSSNFEADAATAANKNIYNFSVKSKTKMM